MEVFETNVLGEILDFLEPYELAIALQTNRAFYYYGKSESIWQKFTKKIFPWFSSTGHYEYFVTHINDLISMTKSVSSVITKSFSSLRFTSIYPNLASILNQDLLDFFPQIQFPIHPFNQSELPEILKPEEFASQTGIEIPPSLFYLYYICNSVHPQPDHRVLPGFFGTYRFYDNIVNYSFLSVEQAFSHYKYPLFPFARCNFSESYIGVDVSNELRYGTGAVFKYTRSPEMPFLFLSASLVEFLESYSYKLLNNFIRISSYINLFEFNEHSSDVTTEGIRIKARSEFCLEYSSRERYIWAYEIEIGPDNPLKKWKLLTRTWRIIEDNGTEHTVDRQPGVIGLYPKVHQGSEPVIYQSCTHLSCLGGRMEGFFTFANEEDRNEQIDAQVGTFQLRLPPRSELVSRVPPRNSFEES